LIKQEPKNHFSKFLIIAVLLHVLLLLNLKCEKVNTNKVQTVKSFDVNLTKTVTKKKPQKNKSKKKTNSLNNFMPRKSNWAEQIVKSKPFRSREEAFAENFKDSHFDLLIWEKINKVLYYPEVFTYFLIEGDVKADISINYDGTLKDFPYVKRQSSKHLEQFIFTQLKKAFKTPFEENRRGKKGRVYSYKVNFKFYISYNPGEVVQIRNMKSENKNLNFYRKSFSYKKSPIEKRLPFFMGGGSQINFVKIYNKLSGKDKIIHKLKEKELESFYNQNLNYSQ